MARLTTSQAAFDSRERIIHVKVRMDSCVHASRVHVDGFAACRWSVRVRRIVECTTGGGVHMEPDAERDGPSDAAIACERRVRCGRSRRTAYHTHRAAVASSGRSAESSIFDSP
jgi:hypothetical protein